MTEPGILVVLVLMRGKEEEEGGREDGRTNTRFEEEEEEEEREWDEFIYGGLVVPSWRRKGTMAVTSATRALRDDTAPETFEQVSHALNLHPN